jgi:hypothetical protein
VIRRLVRASGALCAVLALLGIFSTTLRAAPGCTMMDLPVHEGHHAPDPEVPVSHDRCPDLAGCTPPIAPAAERAGLGTGTPAPGVPIAAPPAMRRGPVATPEPPPPRS